MTEINISSSESPLRPFDSFFSKIDFNIDDFSEHEIQKTDEPEIEEKRCIETILVVDDEKLIRDIFKQALEKYGYKVEIACDGNEAIEIYYRNPSDLIITDIFMPKKDGHSMMIEILRDFPGAKIFAITGYKSFDSDMELDIAKGIGALNTFYKPVKFETILAAIKDLDC